MRKLKRSKAPEGALMARSSLAEEFHILGLLGSEGKRQRLHVADNNDVDRKQEETMMGNQPIQLLILGAGGRAMSTPGMQALWGLSWQG